MDHAMKVEHYLTMRWHKECQMYSQMYGEIPLMRYLAANRPYMLKSSYWKTAFNTQWEEYLKELDL